MSKNSISLNLPITLPDYKTKKSNSGTKTVNIFLKAVAWKSWKDHFTSALSNAEFKVVQATVEQYSTVNK